MSTEDTQAGEVAPEASAESTAPETTTEAAPEAAAEPKEPISADPKLTGLDKLNDQFKKSKAASAGKEKEVPEEVEKPKEEPLPAAAKWEPNYKYKAALQEKEVEEFWRPLMKDDESSKKVIDALQKLDGFDFVKESREKTNEQYKSLMLDYEAQAQVVNRVESSLQRGDLTSVFRQLGVTNDQVYQWAQNQLQMMELPPDQRKALQDAENARLQNFDLEDKISQIERLHETQAVQARTMELNFELSQPEVQSVQQQWDATTGQPGAFRDLVIQEAQAAYYQTKEDLTAKQAVERVLQKFGKMLPSQGLSAQQPQAQTNVVAPQQPQQPQAVVPAQKPVIPSTKGQGVSPIKKIPRTLEDLKKLHKEALAEGR